MQITTTGSTGAALEKKLGLKIARKVASGPLGGDQEIGAVITTDDYGAAFFFIDPLSGPALVHADVLIVLPSRTRAAWSMRSLSSAVRGGTS